MIVSSNTWAMAEYATVDRATFVFAPGIDMQGEALDDTFWFGADLVTLAGRYRNDVWAFGEKAELKGVFDDHARVIARSLFIDGTISNGLWALAASVSTTTNSMLHGDQYILGETLSLLGHIEGNLYARGNQITLGGKITGDVLLYGDDIVIRPGTTVIGSLRYVTAGQPIVLDANSQVAGELEQVTGTDGEVAAATDLAGQIGLYSRLYWLGAALVVGIPFMLIFPRFTGQAVQGLRGRMTKCGLIGLAALIITPFVLIFVFFTIIGIPLVFLAGVSYWLLIYLGKIPVALAVGSMILQRRGEISLPMAVLALVIGLFLFYGVALVPVIGGSLQLAATAFGVGSLLHALSAGRGRIRNKTNVIVSQPQA